METCLLSPNVKKACSARPLRVKARGGTYRTSCEPFARAIDLGERNIPYSGSEFRESLSVR